MKKLVLIIILLGIGLENIFAQGHIVSFYGNFYTDQRFLSKKPNDWAWNETRLNLQLDAHMAQRAKFHTELWFRNLGLPKIVSYHDLFNKNITDPYNISLREAYVKLSGFIFKKLDFKIGKQRIAWGTADRLNPTDNLNPYDFEDIMDFGRHNGSWAANFIWYFNNNFSLQAVYIPVFQPATLPLGIYSTALIPSVNVPGPYHISLMTDTLLMPKFNLRNGATLGTRFKFLAGGFDFSVSYVYTYDQIPVPVNNNIIPLDMLGNIKVHSTENFVREHILGFDLAGSIGSVGVWAEAAGFLPRKEVVMTNSVMGNPLPPTTDSLILRKQMYFKYVVGADYTFKDGSYLNFQYLHGFANERGRGNLNDYFVLSWQKSFLNDQLMLEPVTGGFVALKWKDLRHNYAYFYVPSLTYKPNENTEIKLGAYLFGGKGNNLFSNLKNYNTLFFSVKYSF